MDEDLAAVAPDTLVKLACVLQALLGLVTIFCGAQLLGLVFAHRLIAALPYAIMACGVCLLVLALQFYRLRVWAPYASIGVGGVTALLLVFWLFYSFGGFFSCLLVFALPLSALSLLLDVLAMRSVWRAAEARARLKDEGTPLGI
jgi:hypothetical protein